MSGPVRCRACGALIEFCETPNGKRMPMDVEPVKGMFRIIRGGSVPRIEAAAVYRSHFATCHVPERFRKGNVAPEAAVTHAVKSEVGDG